MEIKVEGMNCKHCKAKVENSLKELGLKKVDANIETGTVSFKENKKVSLDEIKETIQELGYKA